VHCSETYEYYQLPFCQPAAGIKYKILTHFGEVIDANRDASTPFQLPFRVDKPKTQLCKRHLEKEEVASFRKV
jgi:hypothetical protein